MAVKSISLRRPPTQRERELGLVAALKVLKSPTAIYAARLRIEGQLKKDELAFAMNWTLFEATEFCKYIGTFIPKGITT